MARLGLRPASTGRILIDVFNADWLVVDLGGVTAEFRPERRLTELAAHTGIDTDVIDARLFGSGLDHDAELGVHSAESITSAVLERLEHRISQPALIDAWASAFVIDENLLCLVETCPIRTALFTNNGPMLDACLSGPLLRLTSAFEIVICSWHLMATKPDPAAFIGAAHCLASPASRLCLVDDSPANIAAARAAEWQGLLHTTTTRTAAELQRRLGGSSDWPLLDGLDKT